MSDDILQEKNIKLKRSGRAASGLKKILGHGSGLFEDTDSPQSSRGDCNVAIIKDKSKAIGKPGQTITAGKPLFTLHTDEPERFERAIEALANCVRISSTGEKVERLPLILEKITG